MDAELPVSPRARETAAAFVAPALLWLSFLAVGLVLGRRRRAEPTALLPHLVAAMRWFGRGGGTSVLFALLALVLATLAACAAASAAAALTRAVWVPRRLPVIGAPLTARRQRSWRAADAAAAAAEARGDTVAALRHAARRNAICLAEPARPTWMADQVAALRSRTDAEHELDLAVALPHLWLEMAPRTREDLRTLAVAWRHSFVLGGWALLLLCTGSVWWLGAVAGVTLWYVALLRARSATRAFCAYLEAAVDLRLAPPASATPGRDLTALARKGS
ncbi:hypothetical protein [Streptacidiphilus jiangxiensis]|uniref:Uncharacterized protein n=1 Tax=Streptacidiphilus jiangxiensis TaxID=235985 RepID=A0A1H7WJC9_STRJI|nr:hypothetical protein [Streptacidiphilus jiangxiensis]SEM21007.1 hypothetical protein SAMN05414137_120168 [Streptacidiphilus jiangxiensis]